MAADFQFERLYEDLTDTYFHSAALQIFHDEDYVGSTLWITLQIRMGANDFIIAEPSFTTITNAPPATLDKDDYREQMFQRATTKTDFTIITLDGSIETVRYLLYLTIDEIRTLVNLNPALHQITIDFHKQVVQEMINYALKGTFALLDSSPETIDEFIRCLRTYRPHGFWQLIRYIAAELGRKIAQRWNTIRLEDVLRYLRLSMRHQFRELFTRTVVIIANVHYSTFVRDYNSNSTGEQLEIYKELKDSSVPVDGNVLRKIESTYHSGRHTKRILRCKKSDYCER